MLKIPLQTTGYNLTIASHGIGFYPLERQNFLQILYDGLPDKSFIRTNAGVEDVAQFADRVEVKLKDGSVEVGDMVLGCDGVHSHMRTLMWQHAGKTSPGLIPNTEKTCMLIHHPYVVDVTNIVALQPLKHPGRLWQ